jgi:acyl carrier protein
MDKKEILAKLQVIFRDIFDNEEIVISSNTVPDDIEEWDSLSHIQITKELEDVFKIRLTSKEVLSWVDVGEMVDLIQAKLK